MGMLPKRTHPIFRSAQQKARLKAPQGTRAAYQKNLHLWHNHGHTNGNASKFLF